MKILTNCRLCKEKKFEDIISYQNIANDGFYSEKISNSSLKKYPFTLLKCSNCNLLQLREIISSSVYEDYNFSSQNIQLIKEWMEYIAKHISTSYSVKKKKVLEVGSGDGSFLSYFTKNNFTIGIEPSEKLVKHANKNKVFTMKSYFTSELTRGLKKKYKTGFDVIFVRHVFEHIENIQEFMKNIYIILKEGGILYIESPDAQKIISEQNYFNLFYEHLNYFTIKNILDLGGQHGFTLKEYGYNKIHNGSFYVILEKVNLSISKNEINDFKNKFKLLQNKLSTLKKKIEDKKVAGYGGANKTFSILQLSSLTNDEIVEIYDKNVNIQGKYIQNFNIPIVAPKQILKTKPDCVIIFATAYQDEIINDLKKIGYKGKVVTLFPKISTTVLK